jgi:hypothetical protein
LNGIIKEHSYENRPRFPSGRLPQAFESERHRLDLEPLLQDPAALQKLTVVYLPLGQKGWIQLFFVRGDGSLILQAHPDRPMAFTDIPTCRTKVDQDVVKNLVQLIIQRHFFELPEKYFIFLYMAQGNEELELHTITVADGLAKTSRTFGVGKFAGKEEKIPPDFSAIEDELKRLKNSAFPPDGKPCHFAPAIKF